MNCHLSSVFQAVIPVFSFDCFHKYFWVGKDFLFIYLFFVFYFILLIFLQYFINWFFPLNIAARVPNYIVPVA